MGKQRRAARRRVWLQMVEQRPSVLDGRFIMQVSMILWVSLRLLTFALEWIYLQQNHLNLTILQGELLSIGFTCLICLLAWHGLQFMLLLPMVGSVVSLWQMVGTIDFGAFLKAEEYLYALYVAVLLVGCFSQFFLCGMLLSMPCVRQYSAARRNLWFASWRKPAGGEGEPILPPSVANDPLEQMAQHMLRADKPADEPQGPPDEP